MSNPNYVTTHDIADRLGLNHGHVRDRLVKSDGFPIPFVFGGIKRWLLEDIEEWEEKQRGGAVSPRGGGRNRRAQAA